MAVAINPNYRNVRTQFYTDKQTDSQSIGTIIQVLKSTQGSFDHSFVPSIAPPTGTLDPNYGLDGTTSYTEIAGDAEPEENPEYQYEGYIYCDGSEYNIKDYPALFEAIGNDYGGVASDGIDVLNGGANYDTATELVIAEPPGLSSGDPVYPGVTPIQAAAQLTVVDGVIVGAELTNVGRGYDPENPPTYSFANAGPGNGATISLRINADNGRLQGITKSNIWDYWPEANLGTFAVPDLLAKRIVGNGPVFGANSPNVGNSELGVGPDTVDGNWYMDKNAQKGQFSLGNITTTDYAAVVDTVEGSIIGGQTVSVSLSPKKLAGAPQHNHFLFHSEAPEDSGNRRKVTGERYTVSYKPGNGKVTSFYPPGGIAFTHTHVLSKGPILDNSVGTYDVYNWSGGDQQSGSTKDVNYYYASGGLNSGAYQEITTIPTQIAKTFTSGSEIGGREVISEGIPVYENEVYEFSSEGAYNAPVPTDVTIATFTLYGGSGSGGVFTQSGNSGTGSSMSIGTIVNVTAGGGGGGGAATDSSGGTGGSYGNYTISGSQSSQVTITQTLTAAGGTGGDGGDGKFWYKTLRAAGQNVNNSPNYAGGVAEGTGATALGRGGSNGKARPINDTGTASYTHSYDTDLSGPVSSSDSTGDEYTWTLLPSNENYEVVGVTFEVAGGGGRDCGNFGGNGCGAAGEGGAGKRIKASLLSNRIEEDQEFLFQPGQWGRTYASTAPAAHNGGGGRGGDGYGSNDGGGGGAATIVKTVAGNITIIGAGGGGGGGGFGEGSCGQNGRNNNEPGDAVIETAESLFTGGGGAGGGYGCTGGGGGGGGGGCGRSGDGLGGASGTGGGAQGSGGHEEGYGGRRGCSALRNDYFESPTVDTNDNIRTGWVKVTTTEDRGYWTSGAGGGGVGGFVQFTIPPETLLGVSSVTVNVGAGGGAVSQSGVASSAGDEGYAEVKFSKIVGYEGGTTGITTGDVFVAGSGGFDNGVNFFASGTGTTDAGGFKIATDQEPTIEFIGGGGNGATAECVLTTTGIIDDVVLTNPGQEYTSAPRVRVNGGVGVNNQVTVNFDPLTGQLKDLFLVNSSLATHYLKFGGTQETRFVVTDNVNAEEVSSIVVKVARGNGKNGGDLPESGGDELLLYYNTDNSDTFTNSGFLGTLVPIPTTDEVSSDYDGTGTGTNPTNWYSYAIDLPEAAQIDGARFIIAQSRAAASGANDSAGNTDQYGLVEMIFEKKAQTDLVFVASEGKIAKTEDIQTYDVRGEVGTLYNSGIFANDSTITLSSSNPIVPTASLDPDRVIPLIEPYMLVKYLIKAY